MIWYLVRHAETEWNRDNRIQGGSDTALSPLGVQQAACLAQHFAAHPIQAVVASGLQRSQETARAIAQGNGHRLTPLVEPDVSEIHLGEWEGLTAEEVKARFPDAYARWQRSPSAMEIPGAEAVQAFLGRVRAARDRLLSTLGASEVVIVTHGGVLAAWLADALRADYDHVLQHLRLDNAGITAVEFWEGHPPNILWINKVTHLEALRESKGATGSASA